MTSEQKLIKIIEDGAVHEQESAFKKLYDRYSRAIYVHIKKRIGDERDAEEILSDTFLKVYNKLKSRTWEKGSFKAYLYRVATTTTINYRKTKEYTANLKVSLAENPNHNLNTTAPAIEIHFDDEHNKRLMKELIKELPLKQQKTLELFNLGYSHEEIAKMVGWQTKASSKNQLSRIRKEIVKRYRERKTDRLS